MADTHNFDDEIDQDLTDGLDRDLSDVLESEAGDGVGKRRFPRIIVWIAAGVIVLTALSVLLYVFVFKKSPEQASNQAVMDNPVKKPADPDSSGPAAVFEDVIDLEPFERIRLKENANMGLVSLTISLELVSPGVRQEVAARIPDIRTIIQDQAAGFTWLELRNPDGKIRFRYELLKQLNALFSRVLIRNIYFTHFIMQ